MVSKRSSKFLTQVVHAGEIRDSTHQPLTMPIYQASTYSFSETQELKDFFEGRTKRIAEYGRYGNPTQESAQNKLKALDNAEACLLFSSGMNAITTAITAICKGGDHLIITSDSYRRTRQFILSVLSKFNIEYSLVSPSAKEIESAIKKNTRLLISESPTNPYLHVLNLEEVARVCKKHKVKSLIDSTFATPYNQRPLDLGIDLVIHSITKYLAGHNDIIGGALLGKDYLVEGIKELLHITGGVIDPTSAYFLIRGLKTFGLRIQQQNKSAQAIAEFLENHEKIERVWYPGLASHPDYAVAKEQMKGFGGVVSFNVRGDLDVTSRFIDELVIPFIAPSFGGVETLIEQPALMSYYDQTSEQREQLGIYDSLVRLAVGIEDTDDLIEDLKNGLAKIQ